MQNNIIIFAAHIADLAHEDQTRKWTGRPFIEHPARVAARTMRELGVTEDQVAAAWLHDVVEDCENYSLRELYKLNFSFETIQLVDELTNVSKWVPNLSRPVRKYLDHQRLAGVSNWAKRIKMIDVIDNIRDMGGAPEQFASLFVAEKVNLLKRIGRVSDTLYDEALAAIEAAGFKRDHHDKRTELTLNNFQVTDAKVSQNPKPVSPGPG